MGQRMVRIPNQSLGEIPERLTYPPLSEIYQCRLRPRVKAHQETAPWPRQSPLWLAQNGSTGTAHWLAPPRSQTWTAELDESAPEPLPPPRPPDTPTPGPPVPWDSAEQALEPSRRLGELLLASPGQTVPHPGQQTLRPPGELKPPAARPQPAALEEARV